MNTHIQIGLLPARFTKSDFSADFPLSHVSLTAVLAIAGERHPDQVLRATYIDTTPHHEVAISASACIILTLHILRDLDIILPSVLCKAAATAIALTEPNERPTTHQRYIK